MFIIFNNHAVNFDMVTQLCEVSPGKVRIDFGAGDSLFVNDVTIDQILTALAAGQQRVKADADLSPLSPPQEVIERRRKGLPDYEKPPLGQPPMQEMSRQHFDDGSKRGPTGPGGKISGGYDQLKSGNDPQAMNSIGRLK